MDALVYLNNQVVQPDEAKVSVFDRGFLFGDGVYESGRAYGKCFLFLEEHWRRLRASADKLLIPVRWSEEQLTESLFQVAREFGKDELSFRTIVTRGLVDKVGLDVAALSQPNLVHIVQGISPTLQSSRQKGIRLGTSKIRRNSPLSQDPNIKTSNYLNSFLALQEVMGRGADDAVMCNFEGEVTEGTTFSVFGVDQDDTILTAALDIGILDGITRRHILSIARRHFKVKEGRFKLERFQQCREVFIASSIREILPVRQWDEKVYPVPGKVTGELYRLFIDEIQSYVASHPKF